MSAPHLVERDEVLDDLGRALAGAPRTGGRMLLLAGTAGVGKSSVVRALGEGAPAGVRRLTGYCDALGTPQPLAPLLDMARDVPRLAQAVTGPRHGLFSTFLDELAHGHSLVVIEDVHWADDSTADLLLHVGRRVQGTRALVVVTYRDEEVDAGHPVRAAFDGLATAPGIVRRTLEPLSRAGVAELVGDRPLEVDRLHRQTGGNPFFVTEVLAAPGWVVPPTVTDAVRARARRVSEGARAVLDTVAVETGPARITHLVALGHAPADVDDAVASGMLVHHEGRVTFRHELARLGILDDLAPTVRLARHRTWLDLLQAETAGTEPDEDAARVAAHALGADDTPAVLAWSRRAAAHATRNGAHREAVAHLEAAVAAADRLTPADGRPGPAERADLLATLARELSALDRRAEATAIFSDVVALRRGLGDPARSLVARVELARSVWGVGDGPGSRRLMAEAVNEAESLGTDAARAVAFAFAWAAYLAMLSRDAPRARSLTARAVPIARGGGYHDVLAVALNALGSTMIGNDRDVSGVRALEESRDLAQALDQDGGRADALSNLGSALGEIRVYALAERYLVDAIAFTTERDLDAQRHYCTAWLARVRFEQGRWAEAEALAEQDLDGGTSPISPMVSRTVTGRVRARRGEPVGEELAEAWRLARRSNDLQRLWPTVAGRAEAAWLAGTGTDAVLPDLAEVHAMAVDLDLDWARDELAFWLDRLGGDAVPARGGEPTPYTLQLQGDHLAAAPVWRDLGCPYEHAWALADAGDEASLREALSVLMGLGAAPLAARVRHRLRDLGATDVPRGRRASTAAHPSGLTGRQLEVLELVARGLSDRQIAERLFLSPKTVGHHVSAVLAALGVEARTGAARLAVDRGWVTGHEPGAD